MTPFTYIDRFDELKNLSEVQKLQILYKAHQKVMSQRLSLCAGVLISLAVGLFISVAPRALFDLSKFIESIVAAIGILSTVFLLNVLYKQALHNKVREIVRR
jgi:hypothetical protein